jgi:hypothetical protein
VQKRGPPSTPREGAAENEDTSLMRRIDEKCEKSDFTHCFAQRCGVPRDLQTN